MGGLTAQSAGKVISKGLSEIITEITIGCEFTKFGYIVSDALICCLVSSVENESLGNNGFFGSKYFTILSLIHQMFNF